MSRTIALVEDEPAIRANYVDALHRYGYLVSAYASRPEAQRAFEVRLPDLVIIDVGLGDEPEGGFELCRELRLGADDYLSKDISIAQLTTRVAALFRRLDALRQPTLKDTVIRQRGMTLELERMQVRWNEQEVPLTVTEFWMVHSMARHPGHVRSRDQLMRDAHVLVDDATVTSHIKRIRRKFLAVDAAFDEIDTVHGAGYRWRA